MNQIGYPPQAGELATVVGAQNIPHPWQFHRVESSEVVASGSTVVYGVDGRPPAKSYEGVHTAPGAWCSKENAINWNAPLVWVA